MDLDQTLEKASFHLKAAQAIIAPADGTTPDDEQRKKARWHIDEAQKFKMDADLLKTIDAEGGRIVEDLKAFKARPGGALAAPPGEDVKFKYWGQFLKAAYVSQKTGNVDPRLVAFQEKQDGVMQTREEKDMSGQTGADGGYLIPDEFRAQLMSVSPENSIVRSRATIIPMRRRQISIPALEQNQSLGVGVPRWFGGLTFHWIGEGELKPESEPKFREITLVAKKLVGFTRSSDELLDDAAISLEAFLASPLGLAGGIMWMEDYAFLHGTGVAQPLGIFNSPALITVRRETANKVLYIDLVRMLAKVLPSATTEWIISQTVLPELLNMQDGDGRLIWATATEGGARTLLGLPYRVSEKMAPLGTTGDVLLADFSFYLIGDRQSTTVESTKFEAWQYDKTSWRAVHRVDGQPWLNAPLTYSDGVTTVGPFVALSSDVS